MKNIFIIFILLILVACTPKEKTINAQVQTTHSEPIKLVSKTGASSSAYVHVRRGENHIQDMKKAVEQALRQKGYSIASGPSDAGYVIHVNIPASGTFSNADLQQTVKAGYDEAIKQRSIQNEEDSKYAIIADVLVVARKKPAPVGKRPAVVSSTARPTTIADDSARLMVSTEALEDVKFSDVRAKLVLEVAKSIASTLP